MKKLLLVFFVTICSFVHVTAQDNFLYSNTLHFEDFSIEHGLSQNNVTCIFQDSRGFLWVGTYAGLNCYDGKSFEVFKNDPENEQSISDNMIYDITEDVFGNIWIATENGLNTYNRNDNTFSSFFTYYDNTLFTISDNLVYAVHADNEGKIWILTASHVDRIDPTTGANKRYLYEKDIFAQESENYRHSIFQDSYGVVWIGTPRGLSYYEPHIDALVIFKHTPFDSHSLSNNEVRYIYEDEHHNLWIGTSNGLNLFQRNTKSFIRYYYTSHNSIITGIASGKTKHELWITTDNHGLLHFSIPQKQFDAYTHSHYSNSITTNETNCIIKDRSNILWIGTRNGLNKLDIKPKKFNLLRLSKNPHEDFRVHTTSIYLQNTYLFIGSRLHGLYVHNTLMQNTKQFSLSLKNFPSNHITSISPHSSGNIIITSDNAIFFYSPETHTIRSIEKKYPQFDISILGNRIIKTCIEDSHGNIWVGTNSGIFLLDINRQRLIHFDKYSNTRFLPSNNILCLFEDSKKNIWIGTNNGLAKYSHTKQHIEAYSHTKRKGKSRNQNRIYTMYEDNQNKIWLGTNSGLYMFREADDLFEFYTEKNGLPNNQIFGITGHNQEIWISTNKGLARFNTRSESFRYYDPSDGIQGYEFSPNSVFKTDAGIIFFGGTQGINFFHPDSIQDNTVPPNLELLRITYFQNNERQVIHLADKRTVTLPAKHNFLSVHFAAIEFTQPHKNRYKYILEGLDNEWHDIGNQSSINYSSLPSGTYTLNVIGLNNDGIAGHERILTITVLTPFWKTAWALLLYVVLFGFIIYLIVESRTKTLRIANKSLTEKQKAALEIAKQKEELTIKNKSITDSITYAKRIQWAIMPSRAKFKQLLPNSFIFYMPKDIVSGDFYWITEIQDKIFIAAVDCTGHGVPGAFMSIIGYDLLRNITKERKIHKPSEILDYLNKALVELLTKNQMEDETTVKDGMDLSICVLHKTKGIIEFAGAFNPLYIVRNNKIISIKGDRFSVGLGNEHEDVPFKNHIIKVQKGDTFYMFSDGYADQFGGPSRKKMKYLRFRHLLLSIHNLPFIKQNRALKDYFMNWKGEMEQIDDILVIGFNVDNYIESIQKTKS